MYACMAGALSGSAACCNALRNVTNNIGHPVLCSNPANVLFSSINARFAEMRRALHARPDGPTVDDDQGESADADEHCALAIETIVGPHGRVRCGTIPYF